MILYEDGSAVEKCIIQAESSSLKMWSNAEVLKSAVGGLFTWGRPPKHCEPHTHQTRGSHFHNSLQPGAKHGE